MSTNILIVILTLTATFGEEIGQSVRTANNLFTSSVYKEISKNGEKNFLVSPFSAETVLALAQAGAEGQTAQELRTSLKLPDDENKIETDFENLLPKLKSEGLYSFYTANKIYLKEGFEIKDGFKKVASDVFRADVENIKFVPDKDGAANTMNAWVEQRTGNRIHNLIKSDKLNENTVAVLVNALYFKGNWSLPFLEVLTEKKSFYDLEKKESKVETMVKYQSDDQLNYAENAELGAQFLELPFEGGDVCMVVVLPNDIDGILNLEKNIEKVFAPPDFSQEYVSVSLPKFKIESEIDFKQILINLGVSHAFTEGKADFGKISDQKFIIANIFQKTCIDVNESGVEATAATFVGFDTRSGHFQRQVKQFHVDHPFIFYIKVDGLIVFAGRVGAPSY